MATSLIKVYNSKRGRWETRARVVLEFFSGMTNPVYTNSDGLAEIDHSSTGKATIYVNGKTITTFNAPGTKTVTV